MNYTKTLIDIIEFTEKNIRKTIYLDDIASSFFMSKYHFSRIFKAYTGITYKLYSTKRKLQLLGDSILSNRNSEIWKIGADFSYYQPQTLSRLFKKHYKVTPSEYRKKEKRTIIQEKLQILERDIITLNGKTQVGVTLEYFHSRKVFGKRYTIQREDPKKRLEFIQNVRIKFQENLPLESKIYFIIFKRNDEVLEFGYFSDIKRKGDKSFTIPTSFYSILNYSGTRATNVMDIIKSDLTSIFQEGKFSPIDDLGFIGIEEYFLNSPQIFNIRFPVSPF